MYEFEEDPEKNGLLVPHFVNKFDPADEEEELYSVRRSIIYSNTLNYIDHQISEFNFIFNTTLACTCINSNHRGDILSRQFIRNSISMFEV